MPENSSFPEIEQRLAAKNLKHSRPRQEIINVFMQSGQHVTSDELHQLVKKEFPRIGAATVYRALKLMCEANLARELNFKDGSTRYEPVRGQEHHDHLVCVGCGSVVEVCDPEIERLQDRLFRRNGYEPQSHRLDLYGVCPRCRKKRI